MKKIIPPLLLFIVSLSLCYCTYNTTESKNEHTVKITGQVQNYTKDFFTVSYDLFSLLPQTKEKKVKVEDDGSFSLTINTKYPIVGRLLFGRVMLDSPGRYRYIHVYLEPGDSINFTADLKKIKESLTFSGINSDNSAYLNQQNFKFNSYDKRGKNNYSYIANQKPNEYKKTVDNISKQKLKFLNEYLDSHDLSSKLVNICRNSYKNLAVVRKVNYPGSHKSYNDDIAVDLPSNYYDFMDEVSITSKLAYTGEAYMRFFNFYLKNKYRLAVENGYDEEYPAYIKTQLDGKNRYVYMAYYLKRDFRADIYQKFDENCPYPELATIVKKKYKHLEDMLPGNPAPDVMLTDIEGNTKPLSSFEGAYVYIDFWATWCKPCIREIPYLDKLKEEYKNQNIVFLSVSVDKEDDKHKWIDFIEERNMDGHQLWVDAKNHKIISETFNIYMIPRFVMLDNKGKIIDAKAPRPSYEKEVRKLFDSTLKGS